MTNQDYLNAMDWAPADFASFEVLSVAAQIDALCAGRVDASAFVVGHPSGYVQKALYECGARLLPFDGSEVRIATKTLPFLRMGEIPAGTYRGQETEVAGPALTALVVTRQDWPAETAHAFVAAVSAHEHILRRMHPALVGLDLKRPDRSAEEVGIYGTAAP